LGKGKAGRREKGLREGGRTGQKRFSSGGEKKERKRKTPTRARGSHP